MARDLSMVGHALAAPVRSAFLGMLMDGSTRPASELAAAAGVSASTASEHLGMLLDVGLVTCVPRGRQRFYAIADEAVAAALEQLGHLCPPAPSATYRQSAAARDLVHARLCYDHLAGRLGIAVTEAMVAAGWMDAALAAPTSLGETRLAELGIDVAALRSGRRQLARPCPDWTERRPHLAGALGAAIATRFLEAGWVVRRPQDRGLRITDAGAAALRDDWHAGIEPPPR
ncbi:ArsR/SmtB family transcription factor [Microbacterium cremeum]|uniref:ArsR/SmtB family transcription factor n=1 Tax=Microbacterium cremeum TaxID=2782169 RepID=UPI001888A699|nr:winged helix-turn-helix domain-containing protein [Microbacterium cremeum]